MNYAIIGGGIAGLAAAIRLTELGIFPLLIESGDYPTHKVCGEFFSPTSLKQLRAWDISPVEIEELHLHIPSKSVKMVFPTQAGSLSHFSCDAQLAERAKKGGATLLTRTLVTKLIPGKKHELHLSTGEKLLVDHLIVATGRLQPRATELPFIGFKAHFEGLNLKKRLEMFAFPGAYMGISPIEDGKFNVALLARKEAFMPFKTAGEFLTHLQKRNQQLDMYMSEGKALFDWMQVPIPSFGMREKTLWPNTYCVGDAAGTIPPITGNGLSMALQGGIMAAEYAAQNDPAGFSYAWQTRFRKPIYLGKFLHEIALSKPLGQTFALVAQQFPYLLTKVFQWTR